MKASDVRETPRALFDALNAEFSFTLDAAATDANTLCRRYYTEAENGLVSPWSGSVWVNPPFSELDAWLARAWMEWFSGRCTAIVMLVPAWTERKWWHKHVEPYRDCAGFRVRFLEGRTRFTVDGGKPILNTKGKVGSPTFGCALLIWSKP